MNDSLSQEIRNISEAVQKRKRFVIGTHVRPDGDAMGSLLAMSHMLRKLGKEVYPYCQDPAPPGQEFLPGSEEIRHEPPANPETFDAGILVDCGEFNRVGDKMKESMSRLPFLIDIDHHVSKAPFGDIYWVRPSASSTCEMLYDLSLGLPVSMDAEMATQLYTGIMTDTGSFRYSNTNRRVMEIATQLVTAGAEPALVAEQVYDSNSPQRLRLLARVLATVAFYEDDRLATAELTNDMFSETVTSPVDSEGFISHLRSVKAVEMAMLFREEKDGVINVSMRSKSSVDVAAFAQRYNGGGHRRAAAFRTPGALREVREKYTAEARRYLG